MRTTTRSWSANAEAIAHRRVVAGSPPSAPSADTASRSEPATSRATCSVISPPKLNRTAVWATTGSMPIAMSTWDGSSRPAAHADPLEHTTPRCSSSSSTASPLMPGKQNDAIDGSRKLRVPGEHRSGHRLEHLSDERVAHRAATSAAPRFEQRDRRREPDRTRDVLGARSPAAFLPTAVHEWLEWYAAAHEQRTDALRRPELVARDRERIDAERRHVEVEPRCSLHGVGVHRDAALAREACDLGDRLHGAHLVVGEHDGDEGRVGAKGRGEGRDIHEALVVDADDGDLEAVRAAEVVHGLEHRLVLDRGGHEVLAARVAERDALDGEVVRLGAARGEGDLGGTGAEPSSDRRTRVTQGGRRGLAEPMGARRVAELAREVGPHRLEHLAAHRGGGGFVEVVDCPSDHASTSTSRPRSRARTLWVSAPTEMRSTPVAAMSATVARVTPPLASTSARRATSATPSRS